MVHMTLEPLDTTASSLDMLYQPTQGRELVSTSVETSRATINPFGMSRTLEMRIQSTERAEGLMAKHALVGIPIE